MKNLNFSGLLMVAAPEPTEVPLGISADEGVVMVAWPTEFTGFDLYYKTNLLEAGWSLIPGITNRWKELPPLSPQKFFRLYEP